MSPKLIMGLTTAEEGYAMLLHGRGIIYEQQIAGGNKSGGQ